MKRRYGVCSMKRQSKPCTPVRPVTVETLRLQAQAILEDLLQFCQSSEVPFARFETELLVRVAVLGCCLLRLFLTARHQRLDVQPFLANGKYRPGDDYSERTLKTFYGDGTYGRQYLMSRVGGIGVFPLYVGPGPTPERLSRREPPSVPPPAP